jgi:acetyl-CoA carboxylase biotin carboxyl carrier protein
MQDDVVVIAHITGNVWKVQKQVGDGVTEGETVVILESMKMEIPVESPATGTVIAVHTREGDAVDEGAPLLTIDVD